MAKTMMRRVGCPTLALLVASSWAERGKVRSFRALAIPLFLAVMNSPTGS